MVRLSKFTGLWLFQKRQQILQQISNWEIMKIGSWKIIRKYDMHVWGVWCWPYTSFPSFFLQTPLHLPIFIDNLIASQSDSVSPWTWCINVSYCVIRKNEHCWYIWWVSLNSEHRAAHGSYIKDWCWGHSMTWERKTTSTRERNKKIIFAAKINS